jgi:hypothetical protein
MNKPTAQQLIDAIKKSKGNVSAVARAYDVSRTTVYAWMNSYSTVLQALEDERETMVDIAESALYKNVVNGDNSAIFYVLNNSPAAKRRGWGPRQEIEHSGDGLTIKVRLNDEG